MYACVPPGSCVSTINKSYALLTRHSASKRLGERENVIRLSELFAKGILSTYSNGAMLIKNILLFVVCMLMKYLNFVLQVPYPPAMDGI